MVEMTERVEEVFASAPEVELMGIILPGGNLGRKVRVALHLCLERAESLAQLLVDLDGLAVFLASHGDDETGNALLTIADRVREAVE